VNLTPALFMSASALARYETSQVTRRVPPAGFEPAHTAPECESWVSQQVTAMLVANQVGRVHR
jgi:hypothetical protein